MYDVQVAAIGVATLAGWVYAATFEDVASQVVGGALTLLGTAALVWKLVVDHRIEDRQVQTFNRIIDQLQEELARERARNRRPEPTTPPETDGGPVG